MSMRFGRRETHSALMIGQQAREEGVSCDASDVSKMTESVSGMIIWFPFGSEREE